MLHNTVVKCGDGLACFSAAEFNHAYFRNNLCIGGTPGAEKWGGYGGGNGLAMMLATPGAGCSLDYDALGTHGTPFKAIYGKDTYGTIDEVRKHIEPHVVAVDMAVFDQVDFPDPPIPGRAPVDLRPKAGSVVVDAGLRLPGINDGFLGKEPDIGAYEAGQPLPIYGPRPVGVDESTIVKSEKKPEAPKAAIDTQPHRVAVQAALQSPKAKRGALITMPVMGELQEVTVVSVDATVLQVEADGASMPVRWKDVRDEDLARLVLLTCGDDSDALAHAWSLAGAAKAMNLRDQIAKRLLAISPDSFRTATGIGPPQTPAKDATPDPAADR